MIDEALSLRPADLDAAWLRVRAPAPPAPFAPLYVTDGAVEILAGALWNDEFPGRPFGWQGGASIEEKRLFRRRASVALHHIASRRP